MLEPCHRTIPDTLAGRPARALSGLGAALLAATLLGCASPAKDPAAGLPPPPESASGYRQGLEVVHARRHMAAAAHPLAAEAGREMLREGGSAIDAAVAMQMVLGLVEPQASGIGGGAFILYWDGSKLAAIDGRETAPREANERLFLNFDGKPKAFAQAQLGGLSVGTPGALRALELVHRRHGKLPWARLFEPAIRLAEQGFPISPRLEVQAGAASKALAGTDPAIAAHFLQADGTPKKQGSLLSNPAYAQTLRSIARGGADAFYRGPIASEIVAKVRTHRGNPGLLDVADLQGYQAKERTPVCTDYRRWRVCGMPPPSSGGIAVAQILGVLQYRDLPAVPPLGTPGATGAAAAEPQADAVHVVAEAGRLAFADRGLFVADSDFVPVNVAGLVDPGYLQQRGALITARSMGKASPGTPPGSPVAFAPDPSPLRSATSQLVAVDAQGQAISMTTSIEAQFGSHLMVGGFLLNNQLTDFSFSPAEPDAQGVMRPVANRVQGGKRPRSSMAPTMVFDRQTGQLVQVVGSPGGSQIISYVAKMLVATLDWNIGVQDAINFPNFGSRNGPTEVERGLVNPALVEALKARGHQVAEIEMTSGVQAIVRSAAPDGSAQWAGGADPRREGVVLGD